MLQNCLRETFTMFQMYPCKNVNIDNLADCEDEFIYSDEKTLMSMRSHIMLKNRALLQNSLREKRLRCFKCIHMQKSHDRSLGTVEMNLSSSLRDRCAITQNAENVKMRIQKRFRLIMFIEPNIYICLPYIIIIIVVIINCITEILHQVFSYA